VDGRGNVTNVVNAFSTNSFTSDANGNLTVLEDANGTSTITYDAQGRETEADYDHGISVSYDFDSHLDWNAVDGPTIGHLERRFDQQGAARFVPATPGTRRLAARRIRPYRPVT